MQKEIEKEILIKEAFAISKYLYRKQKISNSTAYKYVLLHQHKQLILTEKEQRLLRFCIKHNILFSLADSGLKYTNPKSAILQKMYYMSAIIEATPDYYNFYILDKKGNILLSLIKFLFMGAWAVCKIIFGYIFIKIFLQDE